MNHETITRYSFGHELVMSYNTYRSIYDTLNFNIEFKRRIGYKNVRAAIFFVFHCKPDGYENKP